MAKNWITKDLADDGDYLYYKDSPVSVVPSEIPPFAEIAQNISLILPATALIKVFRTAANGKRLYLTKVDFHLMDVSGLVINPATLAGYPKLDMGFGTDKNEIASQFSLTGLSTVHYFMPSVVQNVTASIPANTDVFIKILVPAAATSYKVMIRFLGYYYGG